MLKLGFVWDFFGWCIISSLILLLLWSIVILCFFWVCIVLLFCFIVCGVVNMILVNFGISFWMSVKYVK